MQNKTQYKPNIKEIIDESMLGGIKIVSGFLTFDGTVKNSLDKLKLSFN